MVISNCKGRGASRQHGSPPSLRACVYKKLLDKHGGRWDTPRLCLWARCICAQHHSRYDNPPDLPAFKERQPKKRKESLSNALRGLQLPLHLS